MNSRPLWIEKKTSFGYGQPWITLLKGFWLGHSWDRISTSISSVTMRLLPFCGQWLEVGLAISGLVMVTVFTPSLLTLKTTLLVRPIWQGWKVRTLDWGITWRDYIARLYATQSLRKCCRFRFGYYFSTSDVKIKNPSQFFLDHYEYMQRQKKMKHGRICK